MDWCAAIYKLITMKKLSTGLFALGLACTLTAQEKKIDRFPISINQITADQLEKDGRVVANLNVVLPIAQNPGNYGAGFNVDAHYVLGSRPNKVYSGFTHKDVDQIEVLKSPTARVFNTNVLGPIINLIPNKIPDATEPFYGFQENPWNVYGGAGYTFLTGKKYSLGNMPFKNDGVSIIYANAGITHHPCMRGDISADAGPAMILFKQGSELGYRLSLTGSFDFAKPTQYYSRFWSENNKPKLNLGVYAGISFQKFKDVDGMALLHLGVRGGF